MSADMILRYNIDLDAPLVPRMTGTLMMRGDNLANTFEIAVTKGKEPFDLAGYAPVFKMVRADGGVPEITGTAEGNVIRITLLTECYQNPGQYAASIKLINAITGERRTILKIYGEIGDDGGMPTIIPGGQIPDDIESLLAMLDELREATTAANTAAQTANSAAAEAVNIANNAAAEAKSTAEAAGAAAIQIATEATKEISAQVAESDVRATLLTDTILNTIQQYAFAADGTISRISHMRDGQIVRVDAYTFTEDAVEETRTLSTDESLTIITNLTTLETTVTYTVPA